MRDLVTIGTAIRAAETGHLVMGTLHTVDAPQTIDRIIDIFPADQQPQIRLQLSQVLETVLSQALLPREEGGRAGAFEVLVATPAVRNLIREAKTYGLHNAIQLGAKDQMQTLDQALADLVKSGVVSKKEAMMKSSKPEQFSESLNGQNGGFRPAVLAGVN
jgi:twitching motility protein PilT